MDHIDDHVSGLVAAWESLLGDIIKLLARNGITVPLPGGIVIPGLTQAAIIRTIDVLYMDRGEEEAVNTTAAAILKWLTVGNLLEEAYSDPQSWRLLAVELHLMETGVLADKARELLDLRDSQN